MKRNFDTMDEELDTPPAAAVASAGSPAPMTLDNDVNCGGDVGDGGDEQDNNMTLKKRNWKNFLPTGSVERRREIIQIIERLYADDWSNETFWMTSDRVMKEYAVYFGLKTALPTDMHGLVSMVLAEQILDILEPHGMCMVSVGYEIQDTTLSHWHDVQTLKERIETDLFGWFDTTDHPTYLAPYFCFLQSSGMGKTKIMHEYCKMIRKEEKGAVIGRLLLPTRVKFNKELTEESVFDGRLNLDYRSGREDVSKMSKEEKMTVSYAAQAAAEVVYAKLDWQVEKAQASVEDAEKLTKLVFLVDESNDLLHNQYGYDAFLFRCVRYWLRVNRGVNGLKVVAVFAGTNSGLTEFWFHDKEELLRAGDSSSRGMRSWTTYHRKGNNLIPPFCQTTTIGSCLSLANTALDTDGDSPKTEFDKAVYYGRPLFAVMAKNNILKSKMPAVLRRMMLVDDWKTNERSCFNFLSTRIQMGQTTREIASDLVANGYANLYGFFEDSRAIEIGYMPDPVCAYLAMCIMDDDDCKIHETFLCKGQPKTWWAEELRKLYSDGIVNPEKGDFGEVIVALYLLFCGDELRKAKSGIHDSYTEFSVSLDDWYDAVVSGGEIKTQKEEKQKQVLSNNEDIDPKITLNFIQVCRNSLRSYEISWESLGSQTFLKHIYQSGSAFYVYPGCPLIDLVVPLRIGQPMDGRQETCEFAPMLLSIKCGKEFEEEDATLVCKAMKARATATNLSRAVCLLIVFGCAAGSEDFPDELKPQRLSHALRSSSDGIVFAAIQIKNDKFNLVKAFDQLTPLARNQSELFSSHSFIMAHKDDDDDESNDPLNIHRALPSAPNELVQTMYMNMVEAMGRKTSSHE